MAEPGPTASPDAWASLEVVFQVASAEIEAQQRAWDDADRRLQLLLGFVGVVFAATLGLTAGQSAGQPSVRILAGAAIVCLGFTAVVAVAAYLPRRITRPAEVGILRDVYLTLDERHTKRVLIDTMIEALTANDDLISAKLSWFKLGLVSFGGSTLLLAAAILVRLGSGG